MAKKKEVNQKGRAGLFYGVFTTILIVVSIVLACTVFFRVESVTVEGCERYSEEQILDVASVEIGANLILTPGEQIAHRVYSALPYVDQVDVQKRFPTTLKIVVTESKPIAVVSAGEEEWIIDAAGKLLEKADESLALQYIDVEGLEIVNPQQGEPAEPAEGTEGQMNGLLALLQVLQDRGIAEKITQIDATSRTEIVMVYDGRIKVKFLNNADFNRKVQIMEEIAAVVGDYAQGTMDLKTEKCYFSPNR